MKTILTRYLLAITGGLALFGAAALAPAYAADSSWNHGPIFPPKAAVVGKVASVSGDTLTVDSMARGVMRPELQNADSNVTPPASTTYTVDATNATVTKDGQASTVSAIAVGDFVVVEGSVNAMSVTATSIRDGAVPMPGPSGGGWGHASSTPPFASTTPPFTGNGEPIVGGTISAISGSTLTVSTKAGVSYTVDAGSATIAKPGTQSATLSNVSVGDNVVVQGAVSGTSVTASSVLDQSAAANASGKLSGPRGFLHAIGGFFTRLFGFF